LKNGSRSRGQALASRSRNEEEAMPRRIADDE
jgi:hypothetical protein